MLYICVMKKIGLYVSPPSRIDLHNHKLFCKSFETFLNRPGNTPNIILVEDKYKCSCGCNEFNIGVWELFCSKCNKKNEHIVIEK